MDAPRGGQWAQVSGDVTAPRLSGQYLIPGARRSFAERVRRFWREPDEFLLDAGKAAELLIARIRLGLTLLLLLVPLANLAISPASERRQHLTGFAITMAAVIVSVLVYLMVLRDRRQRWLPAVTSLIDVSLISMALAIYAVIANPLEAANSRVTFDVYFIALGATCLRFDARLALIGGLLAMAEYLAIVLFVTSSFPSVTTSGAFHWGDQIARLIQLGAVSALNVYIVLGMQRQRRLSTSDPLTGLFNRGFFDDYLTKEVERADRYSTVFTVAMIDVDHFKQFNDSYGHAAGDRALKAVARVILHAVRRSDLVARYGGEELVVIFRETEADQAIDRVEEIRRAVAAEAFSVPRPPGSAKITVSAGVASWPADGLTGDEVLALADRRLFEAKGAGRNRVIGPGQNRFERAAARSE